MRKSLVQYGTIIILDLYLRGLLYCFWLGDYHISSDASLYRVTLDMMHPYSWRLYITSLFMYYRYFISTYRLFTLVDIHS